MSGWDNLEGLSPTAYNSQFMSKLASDPGAIAAVGDNFVRDRIREDMVFNQIIPQTPVTPDRLVPMLDSDTMYEIIHLDANAAASIVDFRGPGRGQVVSAKRVALGFHMVKSDEYEVVEQELLIYPFPIVKLVYEYSIKAMGDQHDLYMLQNCQRAVDYVDANSEYKAFFGGGSVYGVDESGVAYSTSDNLLHPINRASFVRARKNMSNRITPARALFTKSDYDEIDAMSVVEQGSDLLLRTFVEGYQERRITGIETVVTTKQDVFRPGNVWLFASPEAVGKNRVLEYGGSAYKLFIDRRGNIITWHTYANFGALIANVGSVVKLKLYGPGREAVAAAGGNDDEGNPVKASDLNPLAITEDELFRNRNLAEQGGRFPHIRQY